MDRKTDQNSGNVEHKSHYYNVGFVRGESKEVTVVKIVNCLNTISKYAVYIENEDLILMLEKMFTVLENITVDDYRFTYTFMDGTKPYPYESFNMRYVTDYINFVTLDCAGEDYIPLDMMEKIGLSNVSMEELDEIYNVLRVESKQVGDCRDKDMNKIHSTRMKMKSMESRQRVLDEYDLSMESRVKPAGRSFFSWY